MYSTLRNILKKKMYKIKTVVRFTILTHVSLVLEGVGASRSSTMEVGGPLTSEDTMRSGTALCGSEPLEALLEDGRVLSVVVGVHLYV